MRDHNFIVHSWTCMWSKVLSFSPGCGRTVTKQALAYYITNYVDIKSTVCVAIITDCFMVVYMPVK